MREIKFRGYRWDTGWLYGDLIHSYIGTKICVQDETSPYDGFEVVVNPETVGQSLGGYDCNDTEIFEGDIVEYDMDSSIEKGVVVYDAINGAYIKCVDGGTISIMDCGCGDTTFDDLKVVGNIHDDPELMKGE